MALIETIKGLIEESGLLQKVGFEDRPDKFVVSTEYWLNGALIRRDCETVDKSTKAAEALINTIYGPKLKVALNCTVGFEAGPDEYVIWVEYREGNELVRRDCHVLLKKSLNATQGVTGEV